MDMKTSFLVVGILAGAVVLTGCRPGYDLQGRDPNAYYAAHPIRNKVISRDDFYTVHFIPGSAVLSEGETDKLHRKLRDITPEAVESIQNFYMPEKLHRSTGRLYGTHYYKLNDHLLRACPVFKKWRRKNAIDNLEHLLR